MTQQSRRRFLKATAAVGAAAGLNAAVLAQEGDDQNGGDGEYILLGGATQGWIPYRLPGDDSAEDADQNPTLTLQAGTTYTLLWRNVDGQPHNIAIRDQDGENLEVLQPLEIEPDQFDQLNETDDGDDAQLTLEANQTGTGDGNETGGDGNESDGQETTTEGQLLGATETVTEEGGVQAVRFTASEDMDTYICPVHPNTMVGDVELAEGGDGGDGGNETGGDENESS